MQDTPKPFFEHLEELRRRLLWSLAFVAAATLLAFPLVDESIRVLSRPVGRFIFLAPTEAFFVRLKIALGLGLLLALPGVLYQLWKFVVVALTPGERASTFWVLPTAYLLFVAGSAFAFFVLVPQGVRFLMSYSSEVLVPTLSIESYVNFVAVFCLSLGAFFEMPLAAFFLAKAGVLDPGWLRERRRVAILAVYIASAFLTPGPDPVTAILLAAPAYILFECSVLAARWARRKPA